MSTSTTLTVRLPAKVKDQLGRLARRTNRTKSYLAADAIADYAARELEIIEGIGRGVADLKAGRIVLHDRAMRRIHDTIDRASRKTKKR